jgi:hypothetical protein
MADVSVESMVGGTRFHRSVIRMRFPESWSSTSLAKKRCLCTAPDNYALDSAFALIEGHPTPAESFGILQDAVGIQWIVESVFA